MNKDEFFSKTNCDRCGASLEGASRQLSWFNDDCLCSGCIDVERDIKKYLEERGINTFDLEGCGYIPNTGRKPKNET